MAMRTPRPRSVLPALLAALLAGPAAGAPLQRGDLLVSDHSGARIVRIDRTGRVETFSPPPGGPNLLVQPAGITVVDDGPVYVADTGTGHVVRIDRETGAQRVLRAPLPFSEPLLFGTAPWGIAAVPGPEGRLDLFVGSRGELHRARQDPLFPDLFQRRRLADGLPDSLLGVHAARDPSGRRPHEVWIAAGPAGIQHWRPESQSKVACWGGFFELTRPPSPVGTYLAGVTAVSAGAAHACAIRADTGGVVCWGRDSGGALDPPDSVRSEYGGATAIAGGYRYSCAIEAATGAVVCWGEDTLGAADPPSSVDGTLGTAKAISAGSSRTCAIRAETGGVVCWGFGVPGNGVPPPAVDGTLGAARAISVGWGHACAIQAGTDAVVCWGDDNSGRASPPAGLGRVSAIAAGGNHTCAIQAGTDSVVCWGSNNSGQATPRPFLRAQAIAAGLTHTCVVDERGLAVCWGSDFVGEIHPPSDVTGAGGLASAVTAGDTFSCAIQASEPEDLRSFGNRPGVWSLDLAEGEFWQAPVEASVEVEGLGGCRAGTAGVGLLMQGGPMRCPVALAPAGNSVYVADAETLLGFGSGRILELRPDEFPPGGARPRWNASIRVDAATLGVGFPAGIAFVPEPGGAAPGVAAGAALAALFSRRSRGPRRAARSAGRT
jgi:hypothetical protein